MVINIFLSILTGILSGLSFDFPSLSFLAWFSFSFLFYVFFKTKKPAGYFFIAGIFHYISTLFWLGFVTKLGVCFLIIYLALYWFVFAYLAEFFPERCRIVTLPILWVVLEFIRENVPVLGFGWSILGYSQFKNTLLIQIADIMGVKFISFIIITVNIIIAGCWYKKKILIKEAVYGIMLVVLSLSYSLYALDKYKPKKRVDVDIVQPNIPQELKWNPIAKSFILNKMSVLGKKTYNNSLVVYPEASWPGVLDMDNKSAFLNWTKGLDRNIIMGAVTKEKDKFYNTAIFADRSGRIEGEYRKIKLVPFGEYVPLRKLLRFVSVFNTMGDISPGKNIHIFNYQHKRFGVLVCFEDSFPRLVSGFAAKSDFLVNITNDAWFNGNPEAIQHLSVMVFRAVENRISIVRSANTGISGYVDFLGQIHSFAKGNRKVFVEGNGMFSVPLNDKPSVYSKTGDLLYIFLILAVFIHLFYYEIKMSAKR